MTRNNRLKIVFALALISIALFSTGIYLLYFRNGNPVAQQKQEQKAAMSEFDQKVIALLTKDGWELIEHSTSKEAGSSTPISFQFKDGVLTLTSGPKTVPIILKDGELSMDSAGHKLELTFVRIGSNPTVSAIGTFTKDKGQPHLMILQNRKVAQELKGKLDTKFDVAFEKKIEGKWNFVGDGQEGFLRINGHGDPLKQGSLIVKKPRLSSWQFEYHTTGNTCFLTDCKFAPNQLLPVNAGAIVFRNDGSAVGYLDFGDDKRQLLLLKRLKD